MGAAHTGRREDQALLTGKGQFVTDARLPNQARAVFLRSDRAHADILSIDTTAARTMPGVLAILNEAELRPFNLGQIGGAFIGCAPMPLRDAQRAAHEGIDVLAQLRRQFVVGHDARRHGAAGADDRRFASGSERAPRAGLAHATTAGARPELPRVTSRTGSNRVADTRCADCSMSCSSRRAARAPSSRAGTEMVVSSGVT